MHTYYSCKNSKSALISQLLNKYNKYLILSKNLAGFKSSTLLLFKVIRALAVSFC